MKELDFSELRERLEKIIQKYSRLRREGGRVLSFPSGKGGVGKTTVVVNLAAALALKGRRVLAIDLNFALPNLHMFLDERPEFTFTHFLSGKAEFSKCVGKVSVGDAEFDVSPAESLVDFKEAIPIERLYVTVPALKSMYDYILLDVSPGLSKYVLYSIKASDHVFVVSADVRPAYSDAIKVSKLVSSLGMSHEGFIVNMVQSKELNYFKHMGVFAAIPHDDMLKKATQSGRTIFHQKLSRFLSPSRKVFERMAEEITTRYPPQV